MNMPNRTTNLHSLKSTEFDVVIVGGGINGAGVARDAASRGMKVALVEADDFASGTSSRSSKLIHGGIRYLENLEFHLVFEALSERRKLFEIAPHLVHPLRFALPLFQGDRVGMLKMGLGMALYDVLALFDAPELHIRMNAQKTASEISGIRTRGLKGAYFYYDAYMDDDRLVIETLRSAIQHSAICINYVKATGAEINKKGKVQAISVKDQFTGEILKIRGKHFVSTVGPWTDELAEKLFGDWKPIMRPSKGIHLTFSRERVPLKDAVVMAADSQKRIIFGIPRNEMVIIGTTDTDFQNDPANVHTNRSDVDYLLKIVNEYFPGFDLKHEDIIASYSGVRPLVADGSSSESGTSREHIIINDSRNVTFVAGGKYTTYRAMAEEAVESFLSQFSIEDQYRYRKSQSEAALNPKITSEAFERIQKEADTLGAQWGISKKLTRQILERHGPEALDIMKTYWNKSSASTKEGRMWQIEAAFAIDETMCMSLRDFYLRRTPLMLSKQDHGFSFIDDIASVFERKLCLSKDQRDQQVKDLKLHLKFEMGWRE